MSDLIGKKLYTASATFDVCFLAPEDLSEDELFEKAAKYLADEIDANGVYNVDFKTKEILFERQIPEGWNNRGNLIWGSDVEISAPEFLKCKEEDFLELKEENDINKPVNQE